MSSKSHFDNLVKSGRPVGEVIGVDNFSVKVKGMNPVNIHALILFEDGSKGFVQSVMPDFVNVLRLGGSDIQTGTLSVVQHDKLVCRVGKDFIGRVISVNGKPLDGGGPITAESVWPVFNDAPPIYSRKLLEKQLESGVVVVDSLFPVVRGQRIAILGDSKSGKSTLATQLTINQKNTDQIVVYCLIAKRRSDVNMLVEKLKENGALDRAIIVVSTIFDSIVNTYLAPYVACSIAEYLWQKCNQDTIIIYDDLTSHAHAYREIALLSGVSPGRDSYPGDMFYAHSSLLERAGRLEATGNSLTSIPIVLASGGDITAFLPTNIMSITDGQWILDMNIFRSGIRPSVNTGLSVTRVGGVGHSSRQKVIASQTLSLLAEYRQAEEYSHFGSELALESRSVLDKGKEVFSLLTQATSDIYSLYAQQLMLDIVLNSKEDEKIDITVLQQQANQYAAKISEEKYYKQIHEELKKACLVEAK